MFENHLNLETYLNLYETCIMFLVVKFCDRCIYRYPQFYRRHFSEFRNRIDPENSAGSTTEIPTYEDATKVNLN